MAPLPIRQEMDDVHTAVSAFGPGFEGCVAQGCDSESLPRAQQLALSHPQVAGSWETCPDVSSGCVCAVGDAGFHNF